jgi:hypothetical protein
MVCTIYKKDETSKKYTKVISVKKVSHIMLRNYEFLYIQTKKYSEEIPMEYIQGFEIHENS